MKELAIKYGTYERQQELLSMITDIDRLFRENGIVYSLCGGTLLGAVREHGFIPWDDDIDILVDRSNYVKICRLFSGEVQAGDTCYRLSPYLWIDRIQKADDTRDILQASTIDLFLADNSPDNSMVRRCKVLLLKMLQGMMKEEQDYSGISLFYKTALWITYIMGKPFSAKTKFRWYQAVSQIGNAKKTKYISCYNDLFRLMALRYPAEMMDAFEYRQFEDISLPITLEYDVYLTTAYGDYMTPPEEEERKPQHI